MAKVVEIVDGKEVGSNIDKNKTETVTTKPQKDVEEKKADKKKQKHPILRKVAFPLVAILTLAGIAAFYYFGIYKLKPTHPSNVIMFNSRYIISQSDSSKRKLPLLSQPKEPKTEESPLNGLLFTKKEMDVLKKRRPVAVMINNHSEARPQSGLNSADIVYETNAEAGITRYLGIFWSSAPEKVGPVRSLRQYYLEWASEYDPLLIRDGCAESTDPRANACGNIRAYGIKDISTIGAWRWNDGRRYAPHNEYNSIKNAWEYAKKQNWDSVPDIKGYEFKNDAKNEERGKKTMVKTVFHMRLNNSGKYDAIWTYDPDTNSYLRKIGGVIDADQETNSQVYAKNVIIQKVNTRPSTDGTARIVIDTISQGDAVYLLDGKVINGKWKKGSRTERTQFFDSSGKPMKFNRGRIWIAAISQSYGKFDIIEQ